MEYHLVLDGDGGCQDYFSNDCLGFDVWNEKFPLKSTTNLEALKWKISATIEDCVPKKEYFWSGDRCYSTTYLLIQRLGLEVHHQRRTPKDQRLRFEALGEVLEECEAAAAVDVVFSVFEPLLM